MTAQLLIIVPRRGAPLSAAVTDRVAAAGLDRSQVGDAEVYTGATTARLDFERAPGCIIGDLYARGGARYQALPASTGLAIEGSDGRFAAEHCWGRYVGMWRDRQSGALSVFREPSGAIQLFHRRTAEHDILFSDPELAAGLGLIDLAIDWESVAHELRYPQLPNRRTALSGIDEILPGECLRLDEPLASRIQLWSPWQFACRARDTDLPQPDVLRDVVRNSVARLAEPYAHVRLELSGGLDSSILALCLAEAGAEWSGINLFTAAMSGDERRYARLVAEATQASMEEVLVAPDGLDLMPAPLRLRARPTGLSMLSSLDRILAERAAAAGADAVFSGSGGDNIFCFLLSGAPIVDALRTRGIRHAAAAARDFAALTRHHYWLLLRHALIVAARDWLSPGRWRRDPRLLNPALRPGMFAHPWLERPRGGLAGSRAHITLLLRARQVLDSYDRADRFPLICPLMAQPVMEFCLAIPSWRWIAGGRDRAFAREAFRDLLPEAIQRRQSKGRLEALLSPAYDRDRLRIRSLLLDGVLQQQHIVDRAAIERATARPSSAEDPIYVRVLELADAELWARSVAARA